MITTYMADRNSVGVVGDCSVTDWLRDAEKKPDLRPRSRMVEDAVQMPGGEIGLGPATQYLPMSLM
jgi:hypothetical protein